MEDEKAEDNQCGRRPKWKMIKMEDDPNGKKTKMEDDQNGKNGSKEELN